MADLVETELARLSGDEMVAALGLSRAPAWARRLLRGVFAVPSWPLARVLSRFERRVSVIGLPAAAAEALDAFGARWSLEGRPPAVGPLLVLSNHPGAYDALALMAALGRRDLRIVAADRRFLRALPGLSAHLLFVPGEEGDPRPLARAAAIRRAARHLREGGALLHFPAGRIEPDPAFLKAGEAPFCAWHAGAGALLRAAAVAGGHVAAAIVSGVHSARAKRLWITRMAERRGVTTLAPLIQAALPGFGDVRVRVREGAALPAAELAAGASDDPALAERLRGQAAALVAGGAGSGPQAASIDERAFSGPAAPQKAILE
jgi:1-acyl-sn-glycerol-3-phosphate acyltransferase